MDHCKQTQIFARSSVILFVALSVATTYGSLSSDVPCQSNKNRRVISNIREDIELGSTVAQLIISGNNSQITLSLSSNPHGFLLNTTNRIVTVGKRLEIRSRESVNMITVNITVRCSPTVSFWSKEVLLVFYIKIWDINDHPPVFVNAPYVVNVSETTPVGSTIISSIVANDLDPSDRGYLSYSIDQENPFAASFDIPVPSVSEIILRQLLSYDQLETVTLRIYVKDNRNNNTVLGRVQPQFMSNTTLTVNVIPAYYHPTFVATTFTAVISRNIAPESLVNVTPSIAVGTRSTNTLNYSIIHDVKNGDGKYFRIDNTTGQLTTFQPIVASAPCLLAFQIKVFESSQPWYYDISLVKIAIADDDIETNKSEDRCLTLQQLHYNVTLSENLPVGSVVVHIQLQQLPCQRDNHVFSLVDDFSRRYFTINSSTGEIRTTATLQGTWSQHTALVKVTDEILTNFSTVFIEVKSTNHNTHVTHFSKNTVVFKVKPAAGVIGQIPINTNDTREKISYALLINPQIKPRNLFSIDGDGWLSAVDTLKEDTYTMAVVAHDGGPTDVALITVNVQHLPTSTSPSTERDRDHTALVATAVVCGILIFLLLLVVAVLIVRHCRMADESECGSKNDDRPTLAAGPRYNLPSITGEQRLSSCSKPASVSSIPSDNNASTADNRDTCNSESVRREPPHELPPHIAYGLERYSVKSYSTASQVSTAAEKCEPEYSPMNELDPSVLGSTVTLMADNDMPTPRCDESLQSVNNIQSPGGSLMSIETPQRSGNSPGITVYY